MERMRLKFAQDPTLFVEKRLGSDVNVPIELSDDEDEQSGVAPEDSSDDENSNFTRPQKDKIGPVTTATSQTIKTSSPSSSGSAAEILNIRDIVVSGYEIRKSSDETQKVLKELFEGAIGEDLSSIDLTQSEVVGFAPGVRLLPHQIQGRAWMTERENGKKSGGILGDMGLGKTYQTICRIVDGKHDDHPEKVKVTAEWGRTTLVVGPNAVLAQWESEINKVAPTLRVLIHRASTRTKDASKFKSYDVVITSYNIVQKEYENSTPADTSAKPSKKAESGSEDSDGAFFTAAKKTMNKKTKAPPKKHSALFDMKFLRVVLDEAHNIKNRASKTAKACYALKSKYRWCLTGTPIQNNVEELFSLLHFLKIGPYNDWTSFQTDIARPVKAGKTAVPMKRLHAVLSAVMLRRTKTQIVDGKPILSLPERTVNVIDCPFDEEELGFYTTLQERTDKSLDKLASANSYTNVLILLLRLRQACCHPFLCTKRSKEDLEALNPRAAVKASEENVEAPPVDQDTEELADLFGKMGVENQCEICQDTLPQSHKSQYCADCELQVVVRARRKSAGGNKGSSLSLEPSAKIRKLLEILDEIYTESEGADKTIVFSQFTTFLDVIESFLRAQHFKYVRYDGKMKMEDREIALNKFRTDPKTTVLLLSFKAGSTGLNLTAANHVVLMDLWWNPALEDQAFDRAHRFGQKKDVSIYKLVVPATVEERIQELQNKKRDLAGAALTGERLGKGNLKLGMDELMGLFTH